MSHFEDVGAFMSTFGQEVNTTFTDPGIETIKLRLELISEEFKEVFKELVRSDSPNAIVGEAILSTFSNLVSDLTAEDIAINHVNLAKELVDLEYVMLGAGHAFGVKLDDVFTEVQASNMSKLGADGKPIYREDGKVLKGPNYFKADTGRVLMESGCYGTN